MKDAHRIIKEIVVSGKKLRALFDIGSNRSYIVVRAVPKSRHRTGISPFNVVLDGKRFNVKEVCIISATINDLEFSFSAHVISDLKVKGRREIDILIGSSAMDEWEIRFLPDKKELELSGLKKRKFTEF